MRVTIPSKILGNVCLFVFIFLFFLKKQAVKNYFLKQFLRIFFKKTLSDHYKIKFYYILKIIITYNTLFLIISHTYLII